MLLPSPAYPKPGASEPLPAPSQGPMTSICSAAPSCSPASVLGCPGGFLPHADTKGQPERAFQSRHSHAPAPIQSLPWLPAASAAHPGPATPLGAPSCPTLWHLPPCLVQATHPSAFGACAAVPRGPSPSSAPRLPGWVPAGGAPGAMGWLQEEAPPRLPWAFSAASLGGPHLDNAPQSRCPLGLSTVASRTHSEATGEQTPGSEQPRRQRPPRSRPRCCGQGAPKAGPSPIILRGREVWGAGPSLSSHCPGSAQRPLGSLDEIMDSPAPPCLGAWPGLPSLGGPSCGGGGHAH